MTDREKSLDWFFSQSEAEKVELKEKYFPQTTMQWSAQWGYHFTFGQIEEMYRKENALDQV